MILELEDFGATHVLCEVAYEMRPPASGDHFPTWQNCGFYTEPIRDETAVHSLEHGAIWIAYDPASTQPPGTRSLRPSTSTAMFSLRRIGPEAPNRLTAWQRQLAVMSMDDPAVTEFFDRQLGRVSETAPEAGVSCANAIGVAPEDPDRGFADAEAFFMTTERGHSLAIGEEPMRSSWIAVRGDAAVAVPRVGSFNAVEVGEASTPRG